MDFVSFIDRRPPAGEAMISVAERQLKSKLPSEYIEFLSASDGGECFVGDAYVNLWGVEELATMNAAYEVRKYVPGLLIFGSDGGGEAFGFDTRNSNWPIVRIPFVGMDWSLARPVGDSFKAFLEALNSVS